MDKSLNAELIQKVKQLFSQYHVSKNSIFDQSFQILIDEITEIGKTQPENPFEVHIINQVKRIFDQQEINRMHAEDQFFKALIQLILSELPDQKEYFQSTVLQLQKEPNDIKVELMINIEGIINELYGTTRKNRFTFGLDISKKALGIFAMQVQTFLSQYRFSKNDVIVFYNDSTLKTGRKGFVITKNEVITNSTGLFKAIPFRSMTRKPELIHAPKKEVIRLHHNEGSVDIKVKANEKNISVVLEVMQLLYQYAMIEKKELEDQ